MLSDVKMSSAHVPELALKGYELSTQRRHRALLHEAIAASKATATHQTTEVTIVEWTIRHLHTRSIERQWQATTLLTALAGAQGAYNNLAIYSSNAVDINLNSTSTFRRAARAAASLARQILKEMPPAMSQAQAMLMIEAASRHSREAGALAALQWHLCARLHDLQQLAPGDVSPVGRSSFRVCYRRGKTVKGRGPFTVVTSMPQKWAKVVQQHLLNVSKRTSMAPAHEQRIFSQDLSTRTFMIQVEPKLKTIRAIRRGALQHLAASPSTSLQDLLRFSGHKSQATLMRYLNYGEQAVAENTAMMKTAELFLQS